MIDKEDQIFSSHQQETLKKSLDKIGDEIGVNLYDVQKQNQILSGRLDQMPYLYKSKTESAQTGVLSGIFGGGNTLVAPGIALALTFTLGVVASQFYSSHYGGQGSGQMVDVLRSGEDSSGKPLVQGVRTQNPTAERAKYLDAALRAELKIQFSQVGDILSMQVFGLEATNPKQLEFKAITGLSPTQAGSVIFTFSK
jgi:hypothetical protein